jgi:uroporphyrinogen decarboxylase
MAGMDIGEVKERYGHRIAVVGNVDCSILLPLGTEAEVIEAVKETIAKASVGGGHILSSSNSIHPAVKPENYGAMVTAAREHGKYPLDSKMVATCKSKNYSARFRRR